MSAHERYAELVATVPQDTILEVSARRMAVLVEEHTAVCRERDEHKQITEGFYEEWDHTRTRAIELERERDETRVKVLEDVREWMRIETGVAIARNYPISTMWRHIAVAVRARVDAELQRLAPKEAQPKREEEADGK